MQGPKTPHATIAFFFFFPDRNLMPLLLISRQASKPFIYGK